MNDRTKQDADNFRAVEQEITRLLAENEILRQRAIKIVEALARNEQRNPNTEQ